MQSGVEYLGAGVNWASKKDKELSTIFGQSNNQLDL